LIAEQVAEVEPIFTYKNDKDQIEGVKYQNMIVVLINAINEQQAQLQRQQQQIDALIELAGKRTQTAAGDGTPDR
jgi:hypothetical protein